LKLRELELGISRPLLLSAIISAEINNGGGYFLSADYAARLVCPLFAAKDHKEHFLRKNVVRKAETWRALRLGERKYSYTQSRKGNQKAIEIARVGIRNFKPGNAHPYDF
jgi:hypothetical protein